MSLRVADDDPYGPDNLPYGSGRTPDGRRHLLVRVGDHALSLTLALAHGPDASLVADGTLDALFAAGPSTWARLRAQLQDRLAADPGALQPHAYRLDELTLLLPFTVADYVDFYASEHHASNVGRIFRPGSEPLTPNWKHLPIGYHGRAGTVVVSGTPVRRPLGQARRDGAADGPGRIAFGPCEALDFEAELGVVVGAGSDTPVPVGALAEHVFGVCLLNDWSARDIQFFEAQPLGPFLGKSFATSVSAWITPLAALEGAWTPPPPRDVPLADYLDDAGVRGGLDIDIEVRLNHSLVARGPYRGMYWTPAQMLAHMTVNGASLRPGDLYGSGTVSGPGDGERACLLEATRHGTRPITLDDGSTRGYLQDGDEVTMTATAPSPSRPGGRIALGEVHGRVVAARPA